MRAVVHPAAIAPLFSALPEVALGSPPRAAIGKLAPCRATAVRLGIVPRAVNRGGSTNAPWERLPSRLPPQHPQRGEPAVKHRRLQRKTIERVMNRLKPCRCLATRDDKRATNEQAMLGLVAMGLQR